MIENYWYEPLSLRTAPIEWGKDNENNAFDDLRRKYGQAVKKCGLYISRRYPNFGASPDGVFEDFLIEIK